MSIDNSLILRYPEISKEWDCIKNDPLTPGDVSSGSQKKVWWSCSKGHSYRATIANRTYRKSGCPYCSGKKACKDNCFSTLYPDIAKEWDLQKNENNKPEHYTPKSGKKFWWKCDLGHSYLSAIRSRTAGRGCPFCAGKMVCAENSLENLFPEVSKEWHPKLNGKKRPSNFTYGCKEKVWWFCEKGHVYQTAICERTRKSGPTSCPYCAGKKVSKENSLLALFPEIAKEWHPDKNQGKIPNEYTKGSGLKAWWKCPKGHEYKASIGARTRGSGCPNCSGAKVCKDNNIQELFPELASEWHPIKNGEVKPEFFTRGSNFKAWWICPRGHEYQSIIGDRTRGIGCKYCTNQTSKPELRILTELMVVFDEVINRESIDGSEIDIYIPELKIGIEYDGYYFHKGQKKTNRDNEKNKAVGDRGIKLIRVREKPLNKIDSSDICVGKNEITKKVINELLIIIKKLIPNKFHHKIDSYIGKNKFQNSMTFNQYLSYYPAPLPQHSLPVNYPGIAQEWDYEKNMPLVPESFSSGSGFKVWWICLSGHSYEATIVKRTNGRNCPFCSGKKVSKENSFALNYPSLANEWDNDKNEFSVAKYTKGSGYNAWWSCLQNHHYQSPIISRVQGSGCPYCNKRVVTKDNNIQMMYPNIAKHWHPTLNKGKSPVSFTKTSTFNAWWRCPKGHEYSRLIRTQIKYNDCPKCTSFGVLCPDVAKEWHPIRNAELSSFDFQKYSGKSVWWLCPKGHEYKTVIAYRAGGSGCPYCSGNQVCSDNCFANKYPNLALEWSDSKNDSKTPFDFTAGSSYKAWWQCKNKHIYQAAIIDRVQGNSCPYCAGKKANEDNSLAAIYPAIAIQWHPSKNGSLLPSQVTPGSGKVAWWICPQNHIYQKVIRDRCRIKNKDYCPRCNKTSAF
ncbi:hypothetical protein DGG96_17020 [Legionella qingyii]|uniref:Treble clef zinc finger domain-containing protein n=1 Tax=Legionella qingyii TaxID=2184757 RepID=A0A317U0U4_9GAMM|nr:zinc-ribbon domain-containing protein [Legionella qingyii]PWY54112.1 hypothetical protein DGG96_18570 [Legionella qingyii]PWY54470.1 hypothetical protein DGG96_17020 [Legionella qingyii]RUR21112.1 hypothetical protein ELY20_13445 [Legionella qingyii]